MTDKQTPTDAELNTILCAHWPAFASQSTLVKIWVRDALQDAIDKWGQPAQKTVTVVPLDEARRLFDQVWDDIKTGEVYANKPDSVAWLAEYGGDVFTAAQLISFADATCALRASHGQAPAGAVLPAGWVPLTITLEGQFSEEVAYGPQIMMDRLGKWLGKYFAQAADSVTAPAPPPECETEAEKRAFAFGWFKALESERMKADNKKKDPL